VGTEYFSKRGWAPNGDFRYKGFGMDHLNARWNALIDRGVEQTTAATATAAAATELVNQGGVDIAAAGRKELGSETRLAGSVEYLSNYIYRLVFNDNFSQAVSSEVGSDISLTHTHNGVVASGSASRFQAFASSTSGDEVRLIHMPSLRFDVLDHPLGASGLYAGMGSSLGFLNRAEPDFHARNLGRLDIYPHLALPLHGVGWSLLPEVAMRDTFYSVSEHPDLSGAHNGVPTIRNELLNRADLEAAVDLRPPALERDFTIEGWNRTLRHVIEPEITYNYVGGIGRRARNVIRIDTTDIATDNDEAGLSLTQRLYSRPLHEQPCNPDAGADSALCPAASREWASWQISQNVFLDSNFGGALISGRRNVFDATLDMSAIAFLTSPRNLAPLTSRLRFEAIQNLRVEWDLDYDPKAGHMAADNIFAGYSWGRTTAGIGHSLLNAVDENGSKASTIQSQLLQPFFSLGKQNGSGFNLAANGGYDFALGQLQYAGAEAVYNWNCCGLTLGYRRFVLGSIRDETQYLYSFTIANFGSMGDVNRTKSVFRDPTLPPAY
jgi:LPS-assembly protein